MIDPDLCDLVRVDADGHVRDVASIFRRYPDLIAAYVAHGYIRCDEATLEAARAAMLAGRRFGEGAHQSHPSHQGHQDHRDHLG